MDPLGTSMYFLFLFIIFISEGVLYIPTLLHPYN